MPATTFTDHSTMVNELIVRKARETRRCRPALQMLAAELPADDAALDQLLGEVVAAKDDLAFPNLLLAALGAKRRVDARHLVEGTQLLSLHEDLAAAVFHCSGDVGAAMAQALEKGLFEYDLEASALLFGWLWYKAHPDAALPSLFTSRARLLARRLPPSTLPSPDLLYLAAIVKDPDLQSILERKDLTELQALAVELRSPGVEMAKQSPLAHVPEEPAPHAVSGYTVRRAVPRIGRNDPCPCGSGKKYKKCCHDKDHERLRHSSSVAGVTSEELRANPELGLTKERLERMRPFELIALDPSKVPDPLRPQFLSLLLSLGQIEAFVGAAEKFGPADHWIVEWRQAVRSATRSARKDLVERLLQVQRTGADAFPLELGTRLLLAPASERLELVENAARAGLQERDLRSLVQLAYELLDGPTPSLGILVARSVVPIAPVLDALGLVEMMLETRDRLGLPAADPFDEIVDERLLELDDDGPASTEFVLGQSELESKTAEVRRLTTELDRLHRELEQRSTQETPASAPPATGSRGPAPPASAEPELEQSNAAQLRTRMNSLREMLKQRHNERNQLRRELQAANAQITQLRQQNTASPVESGADTDEREEELLLPAEEFTAQPVRIPDYSRRFSEALRFVPKATARSALSVLGRMAAGEATAFRGSKWLKTAPGILRQRIGSDYRLLLKLHADHLEVLDLIHRRDLERRIKQVT